MRAVIGVTALLLPALPLTAFAQQDNRPHSLAGVVSVEVDAAHTQNFLAPRAIGVEVSALDKDLATVTTADLLHTAGIYTLSYPGGPLADQYHWSNNTVVYREGKPAAPPAGTDFGKFVRLIDHIGGTAVITVNYGSNLKGDGPADPEEAAAWVAYANGDPSDTHAIGKGASGEDWKTTGYWASLRAAAPLSTDDGYNFLRLKHPAPLNIKYWAVGNDVYGNGYYGKDAQGYSDDRHAPLSADDARNQKTRLHNPALSPKAYGEGVGRFAKAMKAVDSRVSIGAGLNTPGDNAWGPDWNSEVLKACASDIDFVVLHWLSGRSLPPDWKNLDTFDALYATDAPLTAITNGLLDLFHKYAHGRPLQLAVTEVNVHPWLKVTDPQALGLFAADTYASLAEDGAVNIDWHDLRDGLFLAGGVTGPAYFGVEIVHDFAGPRDLFLTSKSSSALLAVHAVKRGDGSISLLMINKDPKNAAIAKVHISGASLAAEGKRFTWSAGDKKIEEAAASGLGGAFTATVPPYSAMDLIVPAASK